MNNSSRKLSIFIAWSGAITTIVLILAVVPVARFVERTLSGRFGKDVFLLILLPFIVVGIEVYRRFIWKSESDKRLRKSLFFVLIAGWYVWKLYSLKIPVERFHLLEYGILAIFVTLACNRHSLGKISLGWALIVVHSTALTDELFQWYWPERYGEWRDVMINFESALMALAALILIHPPDGLFRSSSKRAWSVLLAVFSILSIASGVFFLKVQAFGFEYSSPETGRFRSFFLEKVLLNETEESYRDFHAFIEENPKEAEHWSIMDRMYRREAKGHFDRTNLLMELGKQKQAVWEYRITMRYYSPYLKVENLKFSDEVEESLSEMKSQPDSGHLSRISNWLVVKVNRKQVIFIQWLFTGIFAISSIIIFFRSTRR